jgi:type 1 glutamine amidotransferase
MTSTRTFIFIALLAVFGVPLRADEKPAAKPHIVIITCEDEYDAKTTLPAFAKAFNKDDTYRITHLIGNEKKTDIPGLEALASADLLVLYFRRTELPPEQLDKLKAYFNAGKPLLAIRTSSHGFQNWLEFDRTVLGATYGNHYGNKTDGTEIRFEEKQAKHAILAGLEQKSFHSPMWVYKYTNVADSVTVLMTGKFENHIEPVTWTNTYKGGRVFYTSLGHPDDFKNEAFVKMLGNGVKWCLGGK